MLRAGDAGRDVELEKLWDNIWHWYKSIVDTNT